MVSAVLPTWVSAKQLHTCAAVDPQSLRLLFFRTVQEKSASPHASACSKLLFWRLSSVSFDASAVVLPSNRDDQISSEVCLLSQKCLLWASADCLSCCAKEKKYKCGCHSLREKDNLTGYSRLGKTQPATRRLKLNQSSFCLPVTHNTHYITFWIGFNSSFTVFFFFWFSPPQHTHALRRTVLND